MRLELVVFAKDQIKRQNERSEKYQSGQYSYNHEPNEICHQSAARPSESNFSPLYPVRNEALSKHLLSQLGLKSKCDHVFKDEQLESSNKYLNTNIILRSSSIHANHLVYSYLQEI